MAQGNSAQIGSGENLLQDCSTQVTSVEEATGIALYNAAFCQGFEIGTLDTLEGADGKACMPPNATNDQLVRIFVKYLKDHPETLHENGAILF